MFDFQWPTSPVKHLHLYLKFGFILNSYNTIGFDFVCAVVIDQTIQSPLAFPPLFLPISHSLSLSTNHLSTDTFYTSALSTLRSLFAHSSRHDIFFFCLHRSTILTLSIPSHALSLSHFSHLTSKLFAIKRLSPCTAHFLLLHANCPPIRFGHH